MLNLFKNISIYSLGNLLSRGITFLLLPLYTRILSPADYGQLELIYLVGSVLALLYGLRVENGYNRIYFFNKEVDFRKKLYSTGQAFNLLCSVVFAFIMIANAPLFAAKIFAFPQGAYFLKLVTIFTIIDVLTHIPLNNIRIRQKAKTYVMVSLFQLVVTVLFTIYFLVFAKLGVAGVLYAKIIGGGLTLTMLYYVTWSEFQIGFSRFQLKLMLGFSVFLIPSNLSALILNMSNRYFLQEYQTLDDVGMYSLGAKLAGIIPFLFTEPVKQAFSPYLFEKIDNPEQCKKTLADFSRIFLAGLSIVALFIALFSREAIMLMADPAFTGSHSIVFVLSFSYLFLGLSGIVVLGIHITRKTWIVTIIWPISAIANIAFNIWLIPVYGRMGAAVATMLSVIVINLLYLFALNRVYPVRFEYLSYLKVLGLMVVIYSASTLIEFNMIINIILKGILMIVFVLSLLWAKIFQNNEINIAKMHIKSRLGFKR